MDIEVVPALAAAERQALRQALTQAGVRLDERPPVYSTAWRRAAANEAVEPLPLRSTYVLSPRSTRGATRA